MATRKLTAMMAASALAGFSPISQATDVFCLEGYGAISRGMGGTAVAHDVGPAGMMTNPATLSLMQEDTQGMVGLDLVTTSIEVRNTATGETVSSDTHSNNRGPYFAPEAAFTQRMGAWTFGVGAFAQGGLGVEYGKNSFLSKGNDGAATGLENSSRLLVLNIPFAAAFQVNEKLSVGASLDAMWQGLNLDLLLGADQVVNLIANHRATGALVPVLGGVPGLQGAHFSLTRNQPLASGVDAWGYSGRFGLVYKASPETTVGASYTLKSQMDDMEGNATLSAVVTGGATAVALSGKIKIKDFQMPAHADLGMSHQINEQWLVAADVSRVFWKDVMKDIKVGFVDNGGLGDLNILLPQDYKDQSILSLGAAYKASDNLTLRGGVRLATQSLRGSTLFAVIPATPTKHLSLGMTYALSKQAKLDLAYSHAFKETMSNNSLPNSAVASPIEVTHEQNNATVNFRYVF